MFGLEKFFEAFKDPKIIIPTLLAIIIVGGLGGGIWIKNLKDTISQHKELEEKKIGLMDERNEFYNYRIAARFIDFEYELVKTKRKLKLIEDSVKISLFNIENLVSSIKETKIKKAFIEEFTQLKNMNLSYNSALDNLNYQYESSRESVENIKYLKRDKLYYRENPIILYIIISFIIAILLFLSIFRFKKKKTKNSNDLDNRK